MKKPIGHWLIAGGTLLLLLLALPLLVANGTTRPVHADAPNVLTPTPTPTATPTGVAFQPGDVFAGVGAGKIK